ncbi:hypothetical protein [Pseudonocardia sp. NPDC049154]|uniref:hypothetical protein n=1 Tax=Pseudonocardia sp. NPDC049154 TaxID=3155501 RepID=UPI0033F7AE03
MVLALVAANEHDPALFGWGPHGPFDALFATLEKVVDQMAQDRGREVDARWVVRSCFGMALAVAVHGDTLLGLAVEQDTARIVDELAASVLVTAERPRASEVLGEADGSA